MSARLALFADGERFAVLRDASGFTGRVAAFLDGHTPLGARFGTPSVRDYHQFDVLVAGPNPVLAGLLSLAACRRGLSVLVWTLATDGLWPAGVLEDPLFRSLLRGAARIETTDPARALVPGAVIAPERFAWSRETAGAVGAELAARGATRLPPRHVLRRATRDCPGEAVLHVCRTEAGPMPAIDALAPFASALNALPALGPATDPKRTTAVLARRIVIVSPTDDMSLARGADDPFVRTAGTAARAGGTPEEILRHAVEDLVCASRGEAVEDLAGSGALETRAGSATSSAERTR